MTPKGSDLQATDLIEVSTLEAGSYVTKSITGQELIDAIPLPPSGLTVGTTPIASGTIGRVLFQGTGNVLQQSSSLFWDDTNGTLQTTTTADGIVGFRAKSTTGQLKLRPYVNTAFGLVIESRNAADSAYLPLTIGGSKIQLSDGNVLINTTTDAGFKLDVNGTARVQGTITSLVPNGVASLNLTNAAADSTFTNIISSTWSRTSFSSQGVTGVFWSNPQSTPQSGFASGVGYGTNGAGVNVNIGNFNTSNAGGGINYYAQQNGISFGHRWFQGGTEIMRIPTSGNLLINTTTDAGFRLDVNGTARVVNNFTVGNVIQNGGNANTFASIINHMGAAQSVSGFNTTRINANTDLGVGFAGAPDASAVVELRGTTKGFLPPRMTTTQRNAIASPAAGLIVYDTTLNLPHFFNGTIWVSL